VTDIDVIAQLAVRIAFKALVVVVIIVVSFATLHFLLALIVVFKEQGVVQTALVHTLSTNQTVSIIITLQTLITNITVIASTHT
jgi:hypothetical protein